MERQEENEKGIIKSIDLSTAEKLVNVDLKDKRAAFTSNLKPGSVVVAINPNYYRPTEVDLLIGNSDKAKKKLGWKAKTKFTDLVNIMIKADLEKVLRRGY